MRSIWWPSAGPHSSEPTGGATCMTGTWLVPAGRFARSAAAVANVIACGRVNGSAALDVAAPRSGLSAASIAAVGADSASSAAGEAAAALAASEAMAVTVAALASPDGAMATIGTAPAAAAIPAAGSGCNCRQFGNGLARRPLRHGPCSSVVRFPMRHGLGIARQRGRCRGFALGPFGFGRVAGQRIRGSAGGQGRQRLRRQATGSGAPSGRVAATVAPPGSAEAAAGDEASAVMVGAKNASGSSMGRSSLRSPAREDFCRALPSSAGEAESSCACCDCCDWPAPRERVSTALKLRPSASSALRPRGPEAVEEAEAPAALGAKEGAMKVGMAVLQENVRVSVGRRGRRTCAPRARRCRVARAVRLHHELLPRACARPARRRS